MRPVLVTGAAGFIAGHLVRALQSRGTPVVAVDRRPMPGLTVETRVVDLLDETATRHLLRDVQPFAVLHLAARTDLQGKRHLSEYRDNIDAVQNLRDALPDGSVERWVCTSSQLVCRIGYTPSHDADYAPNLLYGESKVMTERICRESGERGTPWTIVRPTTIWGPGMNLHYMSFFSMVRRGLYVHVGREPTYKSYGYVGNTVAQFIALLDAPLDAVRGRTLYLADYQPIALQAWVDAFARELGAPRIRSIPIGVARAIARIGDAVALGLPRFPFTSFRLSNVLAPYQAPLRETERLCGPLPFTMDDGVRSTAEWLRRVWAEAA